MELKIDCKIFNMLFPYNLTTEIQRERSAEPSSLEGNNHLTTQPTLEIIWEKKTEWNWGKSRHKNVCDCGKWGSEMS